MVSVVVPAYNAGKTITGCIRSILGQSYLDIEVVVVDDGSYDNTLDKIAEFEPCDKLRVITKENAGASAARNTGIEYARGEYLMFVDADDEILPDMVKRLVEVQHNHNADLVKTSIVWVDGDGKETMQPTAELLVFKNVKEWKNGFYTLLENGLNSPVGKLYKKDIIDAFHIRFCEELELSEDLHFNLSYLEHIQSVVFMSEAYYRYYVFNSNVTMAYRENLFMRRKKSIDMFAAFLERNEIPDRMTSFLYIKLLFSEAMSELEHKTKQKQRLQKIRSNLISQEVRDAVENCIPEGVLQKIMVNICKTNSAFAVDMCSALMLKVRNNKLFLDARKVSV